MLDRYPELLMHPTMAAGARGIPVERRWAHVEELARLDLLRSLVDLVERLGRPPATIGDARRILGIDQPAS